jgi:hypothetical protein
VLPALPGLVTPLYNSEEVTEAGLALIELSRSRSAAAPVPAATPSPAATLLPAVARLPAAMPSARKRRRSSAAADNQPASKKAKKVPGSVPDAQSGAKKPAPSGAAKPKFKSLSYSDLVLKFLQEARDEGIFTLTHRQIMEKVSAYREAEGFSSLRDQSVRRAEWRLSKGREKEGLKALVENVKEVNGQSFWRLK